MIVGAALVLTVTIAFAGAIAAVRRGPRNGLTMGVWALPVWSLLIGMAIVSL